MVINGERVWVPSQRRELIAGLKRMGVTEVRGKALRSASKADLTRVYCRERARVVRERQRKNPQRKRTRTYHSQSFAAWTATD
jgi:hypothetical protein